MAVLDTENRRRVWAHLMRTWGQNNLGGIPVNKTDLQAAVDATDTWIENNQASFNSALPQPFRGAANTTQKTVLFCFVAMRRAGLLITSEDAS